MSFLERYADRWIPEPNTGCFIWLMRPNNRGYAMLRGKNVSRIVLTEAVGPPPSLMHEAAHNTLNGCCGPACINPDHLRWATKQENAFDIPAGERVERAKKGGAGLTTDERSELTRRLMAERTPEQRRVNALKGWVSRRSKLLD